MALCLTTTLVACSKERPKPFASIQTLKAPSSAGAAQPKFFKSLYDDLFVSWVEPVGDSAHALRYSRLSGGQWSEPVTVSEGREWFTHFADLPSVATVEGGAIFGQWLQLHPSEAAAYDVQVTVSGDGGGIWRDPVKPHKWHKPAQYGMVSMVPYSRDRVFVTWLDGRDQPRQTSLRMATVTDQGRVYNNQKLDGRVCECCPTDAVVVPDGIVVAYRDRSKENYRDISIVRVGKERIPPKTLYPDEWRPRGCPITGPAIDAFGFDIAVAWFTGAGGGAIKVAFSNNQGDRFGPVTVVSDDSPRGRVDLAMLRDGSAVVCWVRAAPGQQQEIRARRVWPDGRLSDIAEPITKQMAGLMGCLPRMARVGNELYFAWTEPGKSRSIHMAVAQISAE